MPDSPWVILRQAEEAVAKHRPEEAHRLIEPLIAGGYRKATRLARTVAKSYVARALKSLDHDNPDKAWGDLLAAESLGTDEKEVAELRQTLARLGLVAARAALEAGNPADTIAAVGRLRHRRVRHPDLARLEQAAQDWVLAEELADRGEFLRALDELDKLRPRLPCPPAAFDHFRAEVEARHARFRVAVDRLLDAAEGRLWRDALHAAEEVLAVAPEHREAKAVRGQAWLVAAPSVVEQGDKGTRGQGAETAAYSPPDNAMKTAYFGLVSHEPPVPVSAGPPVSSGGLPRRFLLWVDGVGGYLVCLSNRVTFGQATAEGPVDVPLFADVSRLHAEVTRDGEGYVLESGKAVLVNGSGTTRTNLSPGDRVTLGATCQFLFHRPVPVSSTARLELTSGHRLPVAVDGVLLMGNEVMLGPGPDAHIVLPDLPAAVLIYRSKEGLGVRVPYGPFWIDDHMCSDRAALPLPAVVNADAFTFAIEPVTGRM